MINHLAGALFAAYFLCGRFTLSTTEEVTLMSYLLQVRTWCLLGLVFVAMQSPARHSPPRQLSSSHAIFNMTLLALMFPACSILWAIDLELAISKMAELVLVIVACVCATPFLARGEIPAVRKQFWLWLVLATTLMCFLAAAPGNSDRVRALGGGPNVFGRNMGLMFLGTLFLQRQSSLSTSWRWYPMMVVSLFMMVLSGSRGALLSTFVGVFVYFMIDSRFRSRNVLAVACLILVAGVMLTATEMGARTMQSFEQRVIKQTFEKQHSSGRDSIYEFAFEMGRERPLTGYGLAGFTAVYGRSYPHNMVLELFCETGVFGVLLLLVLMLMLVWRLIRQRQHCDPATWAALALTFTAAMFSGDLYDSRGVFLMAIFNAQDWCAPLRKPMSDLVSHRELHGTDRTRVRTSRMAG